jgi:YVTN family beta-propeller protein
MDIMVLDQHAHRLYVADHTSLGVDVMDVSGSPARYLKTISLGIDPNGIVLAEDLKLAFTGNGDSTVSIIDIDPASPKADKVIRSLDTRGFVADELTYDPKERKVYVANAGDGFVSVIDAVQRRIVKKISGLGALQAPLYDAADGMVYLAGAERNVIYRIDPVTDRVTVASDIGVPCSPHGIAVNPRTNIGLIGCGSKQSPKTILWNFTTGTRQAIFTEAGAGDVVIYDAQADRFFFAAMNYPVPELAVFSGDPVLFLAAVQTDRSSKSVTYDEAHGIVYTFDGKPNEGGLWSFPVPVPMSFPASVAGTRP